jgi:hypothetical protein
MTYSSQPPLRVSRRLSRTIDSVVKANNSKANWASSSDITLFSIVRVKCSPDDTVGDLKKLIAAQTGTDYTKIQLKKWSVLISLFM